MRKTPSSVIVVAGLAVLLSALAPACKQQGVASQQATTAPEPVKAAVAESKIAKIVFVGKQNACDCTRKRVEGSWAALQNALGTPAKLPVERLQVDTNGAQVEPLRQQKAMMALPAIYFVDDKATVLELLQGEVTDAQIAAALKGNPKSTNP
jgi:hypothetical protein